MFSKAVLVAFVALCCTQAFVSAAPHNEKSTSLSTYQGRDIRRCLQDLEVVYLVAKDGLRILSEFGQIIGNYALGLTDCAARDDENTEACYRSEQEEMVASLVALVDEARKVVKKDFPVIPSLANHCFGFQ
ncbi:uncharacterized protein LOC117649708 [Thrips palmi]|uniref:Uncharacterized protein LOC117649708 n=1 Tax=Thrips palmi TaxID=161013 RepID=A0A6P8ZUD2_THRPL|nr:uncharacterized protein LOC117649708 [Thrips palmi]